MKTKKARVLTACEVGGQIFQPNEVIDADAETIKSLGESVDTSAGAVKYCVVELGAVPVKVKGIVGDPEEDTAPDAGDGGDGDEGGDTDGDPDSAEGK